MNENNIDKTKWQSGWIDLINTEDGKFTVRVTFPNNEKIERKFDTYLEAEIELNRLNELAKECGLNSEAID